MKMWPSQGNKAKGTHARSGPTLVATPDAGAYDGVILAVAHGRFLEAGAAHARSFGRPNHVFYDLKHIFTATESDLRL